MPNQNEAIQRVLQRLAAEYASDPNIQTIGYGLRYRGGKLLMDRAIIFFVRHKYTSARQIEAAGSKVIPPEIDGFLTDVQPFNIHPTTAGQRDEKEFDPLLGGIMTSNAEGHIYWSNGAGTLGMLVHDIDDATPMALSNWHVWGDGGEEGDDIIQPGHPTGGDHVEAITKIGACGPLITSLIEWEVPSPLTLGLYGGAAGAAIAAAASDYRDPTRRGQDHTPTNPGELTSGESVDMAIEYLQLPLPGVAFQTKVKWHYERQTSDRILAHDVEETKTNTQFLLGKLIVTDKGKYQPGERVTLTAAIWDYQPRPCDAFHVVAHLIPHARPNTALRVVLHPTACPRKFPQQPPGDETTMCVVFADYRLGNYPYKGAFAWLGYLDGAQEGVRIVDWFAPAQALQISHASLLLHHPPASKVTAKVVQFTNTPVTMIAYNATGQILDQKTAPTQQGVIHELVLNGDGIVRALVRGGGGEGLLLSYCIDPVKSEGFTTAAGEVVAAAVRSELPHLNISGARLKSRRCCFVGTIALPPDETPGKWDVHLTVQNINPVPDGTLPEQAATTIGGHVLSSHSSAEIYGCAAVMLLDHAFDVF